LAGNAHININTGVEQLAKLREVYADKNVGDALLYLDLAIAALAEEQGVEAADLVVFGDDWNDIPMFRRAGTAIAVANAAEELKAHADAVIGSNDEDSVVRHVRACWSEEMPACR
jgi:phosphoserine phosphatase